MQSRSLIRQALYFLVAGVSAVSIDYAVYRITLGLTGSIFSKVFGFYSGVIVSFLINGSYTFRRNGQSLLSSKYFFRYLIVLTVSMFINVLTNYFLLSYFSLISNITFLAFSVATFICMIFNFLSMKFFVFK